MRVVELLIADARTFDVGVTIPADVQAVVGEGLRVCEECGMRARCKKCAICKAAWFCNADCQRKAWKAHKKTCKKA
jgi:hypothetical protein